MYVSHIMEHRDAGINHIICRNTLQILNHPNIVKYFGFEQVSKPPQTLIFMEYCAWQPLDDYIQGCRTSGGCISPDVVGIMLRELVSGLYYIHYQLEPTIVLHRDLKPANGKVSRARGDADPYLHRPQCFLMVTVARR